MTQPDFFTTPVTEHPQQIRTADDPESIDSYIAVGKGDGYISIIAGGGFSRMYRRQLSTVPLRRSHRKMNGGQAGMLIGSASAMLNYFIDGRDFADVERIAAYAYANIDANGNNVEFAADDNLSRIVEIRIYTNTTEGFVDLSEEQKRVLAPYYPSQDHQEP